MTRQTGNRYNKSTAIFVIAAVSSYLSVVAGFGIFHIKITIVDVGTSPRCSSRADPPCSSGDTDCGNTSVVLEACLSHHQLPVPPSPQCTFGRQELRFDVNASVRLWKPEALMSLPFNFSWPGKYTLSLTASWSCHPQESTGAVTFSSLTIGDHILPSSQWLTFGHLQSMTEQNPMASRSLVTQDTEMGPDKLTDGSKSGYNSDISSRGSSGSSFSNSSSSPAFMYTNRLMSNSRHRDNAGALLNSDKPDSLQQTDSSINDHNIESTQTSSKGEKTSADGSSVSRIHIQKESSSAWGVATSPVANEAGSWGGLRHLSDVPIIRARGRPVVVSLRVACFENYYGPSCSTFCRPRDDHVLGHYQCSATGHQVCLDGWRGPGCTEAVCSERCIPPHGVCGSPSNCSCRPGWYGEHCERCRTYPGCKHGFCHVPAQCVCHKGWTGPLCDVVQLFCLDHNPCQNGGKCLHDAAFNYTCTCPSGYTGTHCEVPVCHANFCLHGGHCQIAEGTRYCLCPPQFMGPRCQHRLTSQDIQTSNVVCNNLGCFSSHSNNPTQLPPCTNATCVAAFQEQKNCRGQLCSKKGACAGSVDSDTVRCLCQFPFTKPQCVQVRDHCQSQPCLNGATCKTTDPFSGKFICDCVSGYFGDLCGNEITTLVSMTTKCDENVSCQNNGVCEKWGRSGQFFCKCLSEFTGEFCELDKNNPCSVHSCLNGGTCLMNVHNKPSCACDNKYTGKYCEKLAENACSRIVCQNGGTCLEHDDEFVCICRNRFEGIFCEKRSMRKETTLTIRVEAPTSRKEKLEVKVDSTFRSSGVGHHTSTWSLLSASMVVWIAAAVVVVQIFC